MASDKVAKVDRIEIRCDPRLHDRLIKVCKILDTTISEYFIRCVKEKLQTGDLAIYKRACEMIKEEQEEREDALLWGPPWRKGIQKE